MRLKELRLSKNLTQLGLSKKLNVERTTVTMWENNKSNPTLPMLKKIATVLDCSVEDLIKEGK